MARAGRGGRSEPGGIASLAAIIDEHGGALDYDLMTRTHYTLSDLGGPLDWVALLHFVQNLDHTSALARAAHPDKAEHFAWMAGERTAYLLADLIDAVNGLRWDYRCSHTEKGRSRPKRPEPYLRPGMKARNSGTRTIGSDPIPVAQFDAWWDAGGDERRTGGDAHV